MSMLGGVKRCRKVEQRQASISRGYLLPHMYLADWNCCVTADSKPQADAACGRMAARCRKDKCGLPQKVVACRCHENTAACGVLGVSSRSLELDDSRLSICGDT